jgi:hypothetical protein
MQVRSVKLCGVATERTGDAIGTFRQNLVASKQHETTKRNCNDEMCFDKQLIVYALGGRAQATGIHFVVYFCA